MRKFLSIIVISLLSFVAGEAGAADGLSCGLEIMQRDQQSGQNILLFADTVDFVAGVEATGFFVGLSMSIKVTEVDSLQSTVQVHVTVPSMANNNYAREYVVAHGLPAVMDSLIGKGGAEYSLHLQPLGLVDVDTSFCGYRHTHGEDFRVDPSANLDIYYVPNSLGDHRWNDVKEMMEEEYQRFRDLNKFHLPGKYNLYLCPCRMSSVIWDSRFGMMVDPARGNMFALYAPEVNTAFPFLVTQAAIFRHFGYAPPVLSEGYASYLSFAIYDMKKIVAAGQTVPLDSLLDTYRYYQTDPYVADRSAATLARYLVEQYHVGNFLEVYKKADDLNLQAVMEDIYQKSITELESEWLHYVDTISIKFGQARYYGSMAESMRDYERMHELAGFALELAETVNDSLFAYTQLVKAGFLMGNYYAADEFQAKRLTMLVPDAGSWVSRAAYKSMNGEYDGALDCLDSAAAIDSTYQLIPFNRALNLLCRGDTTQAKSAYAELVNDPAPSQVPAQSRILLAYLLLETDQDEDRSTAATYFADAIRYLDATPRVRQNPQATDRMWMGMAQLGLEKSESAYDLLNSALFLETRPFYRGMIQLWLGKTADVLGKRDLARQHYGQVVSGAAASYHQEEARRYLESPYQL